MPSYSGSLAKPTVMPPANGKRFYAYALWERRKNMLKEQR